jgi:hypothetical protein
MKYEEWADDEGCGDLLKLEGNVRRGQRVANVIRWRHGRRVGYVVVSGRKRGDGCTSLLEVRP